jgi:8-oxo-dGTP pyrophosphatase MutT (NUDIX family)
MNPSQNTNTNKLYKKTKSMNIFENIEETEDSFFQGDDRVEDSLNAWKEILPKNASLSKSASLNDMSFQEGTASASVSSSSQVAAYHYYKTPQVQVRQVISNVHCNNCGKQGHLFHQCKLPITSYGIIVCRSSERGIEFLMIRRKDSFGYIDFMRGKYSPYNLEQLQNSINEMSIAEKSKILNEGFDTLWKELWGWSTSSQYRNEEMSSSKKFQVISNGVCVSGEEKVTLSDLVNSSTTNWEETEWEFPKGRRSNQERDLDCALREFQEETGYLAEDVSVVENILPFEEIYIGSNHKSYKHKYFIGYMSKNIDELQNYQKSEVSKVEWKTIDKCLEAIRPYNLEKKKIISNVYKMLQEYRIF